MAGKQTAGTGMPDYKSIYQKCLKAKAELEALYKTDHPEYQHILEQIKTMEEVYAKAIML